MNYLFNFGEKNVVFFSGNGDNFCNDNSCNNINISFSGQEKELEHEVEKLQLRLQQSAKKNAYLKEIISFFISIHQMMIPYLIKFKLLLYFIKTLIAIFRLLISKCQ